MPEQDLKDALLAAGMKEKLSAGLVEFIQKSAGLSPAEGIEVVLTVRAKAQRPGSYSLPRPSRDRLQKQDADEASAKLRHVLHAGGAEILERLWQQGALRAKLTVGLLATVLPRADVVAVRLAGED